MYANEEVPLLDKEYADKYVDRLLNRVVAVDVSMPEIDLFESLLENTLIDEFEPGDLTERNFKLLELDESNELLGENKVVSPLIENESWKLTSFTYKAPSLNNPSLKSHYGDIRLQINNQPARHHRARYQSEGSRGALKDKDGIGFPIVQLINGNQTSGNLKLQIFLANETGRISVNSFYTLFIVGGKQKRDCWIRNINGINVIETVLDKLDNFTAIIDFIGVLKICNKNNTNLTCQRKSNKIRLVFRVVINEDDVFAARTLQVASDQIICSQKVKSTTNI